jgi:hypothetical protein
MNVIVMPAKAGIHADPEWTPAFAGVTVGLPNAPAFGGVTPS